MPSILKKADKVLDILERNIVGYSTLAMVAVIFANVVLRNFFKSGLVWGNELSSYLNILGVYFAVSAGFKYGSHVGVSVFVDFVVPKKLRKPAAILAQIITLTFCILVCYLAARMALTQFDTGQVSPVLKFPLGIIYGIVVMGMLFSALRILMEIIKIVKPEEQGSAGGGAL